jgi:PhzF family phenazine biosynthesis protein
MREDGGMPHPPQPEILRYAAFTDRPDGGNPAGVVLDARGMDDAAMQVVAARVGYSETAFLLPEGDSDGAPAVYAVRFFTPEVEVPFCGHATIASAVALAERDGPGPVELRAAPGRLVLDSRLGEHGGIVASMVTVAPASFEVDAGDVDDSLTALGWTRAELDPRMPPRVAFAGARHLILAARERERLTHLDYDYEALAAVGRRLDLITVALIWRQDESTIHARNLGPSVGIVEDPATGAAAAALGGYLAELGEVTPPARLTIRQGEDMGRPSRLEVDLDPSRAGVLVSGSAVPIDA